MAARDREEQIEAAEAVLASGVTNTVVDGVSTTFDLGHLARQARLLKRKHWAAQGLKRHPVFSQPIRITGSGE